MRDLRYLSSEVLGSSKLVDDEIVEIFKFVDFLLFLGVLEIFFNSKIVLFHGIHG